MKSSAHLDAPKISRMSLLLDQILAPLAGYSHIATIPVTRESMIQNIVLQTLPDFSLFRPYPYRIQLQESFAIPGKSGFYRIPESALPDRQDEILLVLDMESYAGGIRGVEGQNVPTYGSPWAYQLGTLYSDLYETIPNILSRHDNVLEVIPNMSMNGRTVEVGLIHHPSLKTLTRGELLGFKKLAAVDTYILLEPYYRNIQIQTVYGPENLVEVDRCFSDLENRRTEILNMLKQSFLTSRPGIVRIITA